MGRGNGGVAAVRIAGAHPPAARRAREVAIVAVLAWLAVSGCTPVAHAGRGADSAPRRILLFVGDGTGVAQWTAGRVAEGRLAVDGFPVEGLVDTRNRYGRVTDSGASATAYATGVATYNGAIGVGPDSLPRESVCELARERGMAVGLVATSSVVHATPAAFVAKTQDRYEYEEIARQMAEWRPAVLLGGGRRFFDPSRRADGHDLLGALRAGAAYVEGEDALVALDPDTVSVLVGLFADDAMPPAADRRPTLPEMTRAALAVLARDGEGFFLMVEGSQIDWRAHENAPLEEMAAEVTDFDDAVGVGVRFARSRPGTLVVVTADHETGGLAIQEGIAGFTAAYTTDHHTAELVPLFAYGPGAERFAGVHTNAEIGRIFLSLIAPADAEN